MKLFTVTHTQQYVVVLHAFDAEEAKQEAMLLGNPGVDRKLTHSTVVEEYDPTQEG